MATNPLIPNVNRIGPQSKADNSVEIQNKRDLKSNQTGQLPNFDEILQNLDLHTQSPVRPLKFSAHAQQRLVSRGIQFDEQTMAKIADAVNRAQAKGAKESLVMTGDTALIVSVKNRTVVTAMDRNQMNENVITNIDSAVMI